MTRRTLLATALAANNPKRPFAFSAKGYPNWPIAKAFGVDELIAVELVRDANGWFTNEISGVPTLREGKVQRLQQWLTREGLDWADVDTTFYSDSRNDLPLLERVNHPVATNPDNTLRAAALEKGWPILELFPKQ